MRIVGGEFRGRKLAAPIGNDTRPTSDRLRETIFNILASRGIFERKDLRALDLFAGSGALGLEALSRGVAYVSFVETSPIAAKAICQNIEALSVTDHAQILHYDATSLPPNSGVPYDLVFLDAPYGKTLLGAAVLSAVAGGWFFPSTIFVIEMEKNGALDLPSSLTISFDRDYGKTRLIIAQAED